MRINSYKNFVLCCLLLLIFTWKQKYIMGMSRLKSGEKFTLISLRNLSGENININNLRDNNNLALVFWKIPEGKNYIDYSRSELMLLEEINKKYQDKGLKIVAIYCPWGDNAITEQELDIIKKMIEELKLSFPILLDHGLMVYNQYGISALPTFVLADKKGIVKFILPGFPSHSAEGIIKKEVIKILNEAQDS